MLVVFYCIGTVDAMSKGMVQNMKPTKLTMNSSCLFFVCIENFLNSSLWPTPMHTFWLVSCETQCLLQIHFICDFEVDYKLILFLNTSINIFKIEHGKSGGIAMLCWNHIWVQYHYLWGWTRLCVDHCTTC